MCFYNSLFLSHSLSLSLSTSLTLSLSSFLYLSHTKFCFFKCKLLIWLHTMEFTFVQNGKWKKLKYSYILMLLLVILILKWNRRNSIINNIHHKKYYFYMSVYYSTVFHFTFKLTISTSKNILKPYQDQYEDTLKRVVLLVEPILRNYRTHSLT